MDQFKDFVCQQKGQCTCCCCCCKVASVVSDSVRPHGQQPARFPRPWDSPGKIHFTPGTQLVSLCCNNIAYSSFPVRCLRKGWWLCSPVLVGKRWRMWCFDGSICLKWSEVAQLCPTLCDPMDCSLPGSSVHGLFQARVLEGAAISFSRGCSQPRDQTQVSCIANKHFTIWANRESPILSVGGHKNK